MKRPRDVSRISKIKLTKRLPNGALPKNKKVYNPIILPIYSLGVAAWITVLQLIRNKIMLAPSKEKIIMEM